MKVAFLIFAFFISFQASADDPIYAANMKLLRLHRSRLDAEIRQLKEKVEQLGSKASQWPESEADELLKMKRYTREAIIKISAKPEADLSKKEFGDLREAIFEFSEKTPAGTNAVGSTGLGSSKISKKSSSSFSTFEDMRPRLSNNKKDTTLESQSFQKLINKFLATTQSAPQNTICSQTSIDIESQKQKVRLLSESSEKYFDAKKFPAQAHFLKSLDVKYRPPSDLPPSVDFSDRFQAPRSQGKTLGCSAHALVSEVEAETREVFSVDRAYGDLLQYDQTYNPEQLKTMDDVRSFMNEEEDIKSGSPHSERTVSVEAMEHFLKKGTVIKGEDKLAGPIYVPQLNRTGRIGVLKGSDSVTLEDDGAKNADFFRQILASGKFPSVILKSDARVQEENWIRIEPGSIGHIVNLVGYGEDVDPFTGEKKPYFKIRDSFAQGAIHVRVDAANFVTNVAALLKVRKPEIQQLNP